MRKIYVAVAVMVFFFSCREKYEPPITSLPSTFLVVEGNLNPSGAARIRLTKTSKLEGSAAIVYENNAQVTVEGKDNTTRTLAFSGNGNYASASLNLVLGNEYRLKIRTSAGKEYASAYVKARTTPAIDSVGWRRVEKGVQLYVNTKDASNASRYYNWNYEETWEVRAPLAGNLIYVNNTIRQRIMPQEDVYLCWKNNSSTSILLGNSTKLQSDVIHEAPVTLIPVGDTKLLHRYSILVRQYALDKAAYDFLELMRMNTEGIGSLFAPQPSEIRGNLTCITNPAEPVIGFVTASAEVQKRIFISGADVPNWPQGRLCESIEVANHPDSIRQAVSSGYLPVIYLIMPPKYLFGEALCVDCTRSGGTTAKPSFW